MVFRQSESHPLRMYIEEGIGESTTALATYLHDKYFYKNPYAQKVQQSKKQKVDEDGNPIEDELDQLIFYAEDGRGYFPSGIVSIIEDAARRLRYSVYTEYLPDYKERIDDIDVPEDIIEGITLRDYQLGAVKAALIYKRGLLSLATGAGKTNIMLAICKILHTTERFNIIMCVPTSYLLHQTYQNALKAGIDPKDICKYGDGNELEPEKRIVIATVQTLYSRLNRNNHELLTWMKNVNCLVFDEVQHISARSWYTVADALQPEYLIGLSAAPFYGDREHQIRDLISRGTLGSILYQVTMKDLVDRGYLSKPYVIAMDSRYKGNIYTLINWHSVNKSGIVNNHVRNDMVINMAMMLIGIKKNPLILIQQIKHGEALATALSRNGFTVAFITGGSHVRIYSGGMVTDEFKDDQEIVKTRFTEGSIDAILGSSTLDEGVDISRVGAVILAGGGKVSIRLIQRIGRGLRVKKDDNTTFIIDFQDRFNVVLAKHFKVRKSTYDKNQIPVYSIVDVLDAKNTIQRLRGLQ